MTVSATPPRNDYAGTGALATYAYSFRIFAATDLRVTKADTDGVETELTYPTDFSVTGVNVATGGTITLTAGVLAVDYALTIRFDRTPVQSTDLRNQGDFFPETHEDKFDELTRYVQALTDVVRRSLHLPETEDPANYDMTIPPEAERASKFQAYDATGNSIVSAGGLTSPPVTAFMVTLLDDADAATALATLGAVAKAGDNLTGGINAVKSTVASSATPDIFAITVGNTVDYTGAVTCTGFTAAPQAGAQRMLICAGAAPFTAGANVLIDGVASGGTFTASSGDKILAVAVTTTQFRLTPLKADGLPVVTIGTAIQGALGLKIVRNATTSMADVTATEAILTNASGLGKFHTAISVSPNTNTAGPALLGRDQVGAFTNGQQLYLWLLSNGSAISAVWSVSETKATVISNMAGVGSGLYTYALLVNATLLTTGSPTVIPDHFQRGADVCFKSRSKDVTATTSSGSWAAATLTIPAIATHAFVTAESAGGTHVALKPDNTIAYSQEDAPYYSQDAAGVPYGKAPMWLPLVTNSTIYYEGTSVDVFTWGWRMPGLLSS